ncbi:hypothetical protein JJC03_07580 [Flavobacterium oreochromis]|uniref:hypothetical protein n=1 Tax=Flavobacterium oreochromis TaxID=2906078 RepID=UPI001CE5836B|nr:hypothetical protein [Flavobacterium oreochromis]QYS87650.1 hypothetical protein JJC03_07580 [Flavobacterium oreochromis]
MKIKLKLLVLTLFAIIITSCDPPHYIDFINNSDSIAKVRLNLKSKVESFDLEEIATGDSIVFNLKSKDTANIHFGIGEWSDISIEEVTKSVKSIEIETQEIKTIYKTENSIKNLLKKKQTRFFL